MSRERLCDLGGIPRPDGRSGIAVHGSHWHPRFSAWGQHPQLTAESLGVQKRIRKESRDSIAGQLCGRRAGRQPLWALASSSENEPAWHKPLHWEIFALYIFSTIKETETLGTGHRSNFSNTDRKAKEIRLSSLEGRWKRGRFFSVLCKPGGVSVEGCAPPDPQPRRSPGRAACSVCPSSPGCECHCPGRRPSQRGPPHREQG